MSAVVSTLAQWLPSIPYASPNAALKGYWLPVTSTINWCEEDYYATIYAAEIVNTLTNAMFVALAVKGFVNCIRNDHDAIFLITYSGYAAVGLGSLAFHATLKYPMQLVDELSMIYTTCFSCYASFSYNRSRPFGLFVATFLVSLAIFITAYYHYLGDPKFHQRAYALLTATVLLRSMFVMDFRLRPKRRQRQQVKDGAGGAQAAEQERRDKRDMNILKTMWTMIGYGLGVFLTGFGIWQLDNIYCGTLRRWRRQLGLPWGILLEGHGWWQVTEPSLNTSFADACRHLMTGIGAYFFIQWAIWLRHCLNGKQDLYELYWPSLIFSFPMVVKKTGSPDSYLVQDQVRKSR